MKSYIILGLLIILSNNIFSQDCPSPSSISSISFTNQEDLEEFVNTYPNCTEIERKVRISAFVTDLSLLSNITKIKGDLEISSLNMPIVDADGLRNITHIEGDVYIHDSNTLNLENLLMGLVSIGGDLIFEDNNNMQINGFNSLENVINKVDINSNRSLNLPGFISLKEIGSLSASGQSLIEDSFQALSKVNSSLRISTIDSDIDFPALDTVIGSIVIKEMLEPFSITGLNQVSSIGGLNITSNNELMTISGFNNLTSINGEIAITSNEELNSIKGFDKLSFLSGGFTISFNPNLIEVNGFSLLQQIATSDEFIISENEVLEEIDAFQNTSLTNSLTVIRDNPLLRNIIGFGSTDDFNTNLRIIDNPELVLVDAFNGTRNFNDVLIISENNLFEAKIFQNLESLSSTLNLKNCNIDAESFSNLESISANVFLKDISNLPAFESLLQVGGRMTLEDLQDSEMNSFNNLVSITEKLSIFSDGTLRVVKGFNSLENVEEIMFSKTGIKIIDGFNGLKERVFFRFTDFEDLEEIKGFNGLQSVNGLIIEENESLKSIDGFNNLRSANELFFSRNDNLISIDGFESLNEIGAELNISFNPELVSIPPFNQLSGELPRFTNANNFKFVNLIGFNSLDTLNRGIGTGFFKTVSGFNSLKVMNGGFYLESEVLESIDGFQMLEEINGTLTYGGLPSIQSPLPSFEKLKIVESIEVTNTFPLDTIPEFKNLESLGAVSIGALKSLSGFEKISNVFSFSVRSNATLETIDAFQNLKSITTSFIFKDNLLLKEIPTFDFLETIGNEAEFFDNEKLEKLNGFENLSLIGEHIHFLNNPSLREIVGFNNLNSIEEINFLGGPNSNLIINGFNALEECETIILEAKLIEGFDNLKAVSVSLVFRGDFMTDINGFQQLESAVGLSIIAPFLNEMPKFDSFVQVDFLLIGSLKVIESFSSFNNLEEIGTLNIGENISLVEFPEFPSLTKLEQLQVYENEKIESLDGFENIESISGIFIRDNLKLKSLKGFESLTLIDDVIWVSENPEITSIEGLGNVSVFNGNGPPGGSNLIIRNNPKLSICSMGAICGYIIGEHNSQLINNGLGCNSEEEILENCGDVLNFIEIVSFVDTNENGAFDDGENNLAGVTYNISFSERVLLSDNGPVVFGTLLDSASIELIRAPENWNLSSIEESFNLNFSENSTSETIYFGFTPQTVFASLETSVTAEPFRCNTEILLSLDVKNIGTLTTDAVLFLTLDDRLENFTFSNDPDIVIDQYNVGWNLEDIYASEIINEKIMLFVPMIESLGEDMDLKFNAELRYLNELSEELTQNTDYVEEVRCSYDPNDKRSFPQKEFNFFLKEDPLTYVVRFQNTGNDVAFDVVVRDTISELLDMSTFELMGTSHPRDLEIYVDNDRQIAFEFVGINLIDSLTNEPESHGYITYKIKANEEVVDYDEIKNSASIYFDLNLPIHTNETTNFIGEDIDDDGYIVIEDCDDNNPEVNPGAEEIPDNDIDEDCDGMDLTTSVFEIKNSKVNIYPNPVVNSLNIIVEGNLQYQVTLYDLHGKIVKSFINVSQIDVESMIAGIYILEIKDLNSGQKALDKITVTK